MQDDPKEEKPLYQFMDYIGLMSGIKLNLEDREQIAAIAKRMKEFSSKIDLTHRTDLSGLSPKELSLTRALAKMRGTGKFSVGFLLSEELRHFDIAERSDKAPGYEIQVGELGAYPNSSLVMLKPRKSGTNAANAAILSFLDAKINGAYNLTYPYHPQELRVLPHLKTKPPSALKQGRKQAQKRRLVEATNTKPTQRTSGLLNGLLNGLSSTSKDTK